LSKKKKKNLIADIQKFNRIESQKCSWEPFLLVPMDNCVIDTWEWMNGPRPPN